jgi:hypothetical protein
MTPPPFLRLAMALPAAVFVSALFACDAFAGNVNQHVQLGRR